MRRTRHGLLVPADVAFGEEVAGAHPSKLLVAHASAPDCSGGWVGREERCNVTGRYRRVWHRLPPIAGGGRQYFRELQEPQGSQLKADATAITGTAEALMWPATLTSIFANTLRDGQQFFITAGGVTTTPASAATTMTVNPRWGTTTGGTSLGISNTSGTALASQTNVPWDLAFSGTVRSIGTGASLMSIVGSGWYRSIAVGTAALAGNLEMGGTVLTTADSTTNQGIVFGAVLGGSASWTLTTRYVIFELAN